MHLWKFSQVNLERCIKGFNHELDSWSIAEWTNAVAGEVGESCNLAKKIIRHRDSVPGNYKPEDTDIDLLRLRCAKELADVITYADLTIQALGYDTEQVLKGVFNAKSEQLNCPITIED